MRTPNSPAIACLPRLCLCPWYRNVINELQGEGEVAPRMYDDLGDYNSIKPLFEDVMTNFYNRKRKPMNLVFFEDALEHLTRIHRTLRLPQVGRA